MFFGINVTPDFKDKIECIKYMCARIKLHTCTTIVNNKDSAKSNKESINHYYMTESLT